MEGMIMVDEKTLNRIRNVLTVAEQGVQTIPYGKVEVMADGPGGKKQITLSIGFTQYGGNLEKVLRVYVANPNSKYGEELSQFTSLMKDPNTVNNSVFKNLLRSAGEEDPIMGKVQEGMFSELYLTPALKWGEKEGFVEPFSYLIICDSYLHSGSIMSSLRNKFSETTPVQGGNEKKWTSQYLNARHNWLTNHTNKLIRASSYRTKYYKELLALDDWQLDAMHTIAMNGVYPKLTA
jgi:chitosanase